MHLRGRKGQHGRGATAELPATTPHGEGLGRRRRPGLHTCLPHATGSLARKSRVGIKDSYFSVVALEGVWKYRFLQFS